MLLVIILHFGEFLWKASHETSSSSNMESSRSSTSQGVSSSGKRLPDNARQWAVHLARDGEEGAQANIGVNESLYITLSPPPRLSPDPPGAPPGVKLTLIDDERLEIQKASGVDLKNYQFFIIESSFHLGRLISLPESNPFRQK